MSGSSRFAVVPAAYVFFLRGPRDGREVLLQLRRGTGYMDEHWAAAAAGHVERGETVLEAAAREVHEEVGVTDVRLTPACAMQRTGASGEPIDERVDYFFTSSSWSGEPGSSSHRSVLTCAGFPWRGCPILWFRTSLPCFAQSGPARSPRS